MGVGGVVVHEGRVLLIRRGKQPLYGRWVVPGGTVELGEPLAEALVREMREETGLEVEPIELLTVFDRIERDGERVLYHYVIVDYLCRWRSGEAEGGLGCARRGVGDDRRSWSGYDLPPKALEVVQDAFPERCLSHTPCEGSACARTDGRILSRDAPAGGSGGYAYGSCSRSRRARQEGS